MPSLDSRPAPEAPVLTRVESIPALVEAVRLDREVPSSNAYEARFVRNNLLPALTTLAALMDGGAIARNFTARLTDLPLSIAVPDMSADLEAKVGHWKVEARTNPEQLDAIVTQLRRLGIEAIGITSSRHGGTSKSEYAWICCGNYEDLKLITAAAPSARTEFIALDGTLPQATSVTGLVPANGATAPKSSTFVAS